MIAEVALTERQRSIYQLIVRRVQALGCPPTLKEIAAQMGITSMNGVKAHLNALIRKGVLFPNRHQAACSLILRGVRWQPVFDESPEGKRLRDLLESKKAERAETYARYGLTVAQGEMIRFVAQHVRRTGGPPTLSGMSKKIGASRRTGSQWYVKALERKGILAFVARRARSVTLTGCTWLPVYTEDEAGIKARAIALEETHA